MWVDTKFYRIPAMFDHASDALKVPKAVRISPIWGPLGLQRRGQTLPECDKIWCPLTSWPKLHCGVCSSFPKKIWAGLVSSPYWMASTGSGSFDGQLKVQAIPNYPCFFLSVQSGEQCWSGGRISAGYLRTCVDAGPTSPKGVAPQGDNICQHRSQSNPLNPHHHPRRVLHLQET